MLAFAIRGGWPAGLGRGAAWSAAADLVHRGALTVPTANNIVLLVLAGAVVGYAVDLARRGEAALARALAVSGRDATERERLSRDIHDGVLQVLALVGRRGRELGGEAAELGRLAAEQEQCAAGADGRRAGAGASPARSTCAALLHGVRLAGGDGLDPRDAGGARRGPGPRAGGGGGRRAGQRRGRTPARRRAPGCCSRTRAPRSWCPCATTGAASRRRGWPRPGPRAGSAWRPSIEGRVRDLGGTMAVESAPGAGTEIELRVPVDGEA